MHRSLSETQVGAAVEAIYDGALDAACWPEALRQVGQLFNAAFVDLFARTHDRLRHRGIVVGLDREDYQEKLLDTWSQRNPWTNTRPVTAAGEITSTRDILAKDALIVTEMYADYLRPRGLHEGMRLALWSGAEGIEDVSLLRPWSMGPFGAPERALAETLMPHLRRAALISRRLRAESAGALASMAALERAHQPMLLLAADGHILYANDAAAEVLRRNDGLGVVSGRLVAATQAATARLTHVLGRAAGRHGPRLSGTMLLARPSGAAKLALIALPLNRDLDWSLARPPALLACLAEHGARPAISARQLGLLFGFTPAESALALDLAGGEDLAAIAARTGRSINTLRTHLAHLMAKAELRRQSDLVRLLLTLPRDIGED